MSKSQSLPIILEQAARGRRIDDQAAKKLVGIGTSNILRAAARRRRDTAFGRAVTWSPKVFIPLTVLCRDVCHYCTFAKTPRQVPAPYLDDFAVLDIARRGAAAGVTEALFTLGDKPELRYRVAREWLDERGFASTVEYVAHSARLVFEETGLLPHLNPGVLTAEDYERLKPVSVSMGLMLENISPRLCRHGGAHFGSPDKDPELRMQSIDAAGEARVPFTSGILIGIGETRMERVESLLALRDSHERHGHIQEVIVQNFRAKADTRMATAPEPDLEDHLWSIAVARLIMPTDVSVQAPPNLAEDDDEALSALIDAGINDFGGVSPVTPDHVNPESPWPHQSKLEKAAERNGSALAARLAIYPGWQTPPAPAAKKPRSTKSWLTPEMQTAVTRMADAQGLARDDDWSAGASVNPPAHTLSLLRSRHVGTVPESIKQSLNAAADGAALDVRAISDLLKARGNAFSAVCEAADSVRRQQNGDEVSYVVNRNINYTNICAYKCRFCAFSKGSAADDLRGKPYVLDLDEIGSRVAQAWSRGATEVCLQGGIHPAYTGDTYIDIVKTAKAAAPDIHIHAFTPLEIVQGASTLNLPVREYLERLVEAGLGSLPGTSAEILVDSVRKIICPDKLTSTQWVDVMKSAHSLHLHSTATIMFGHVESPEDQARHLLVVRELAEVTRGITELVPLPFVHMEAPMFRRGESRAGPTFREAVLMHAVGRLALNPVVENIQASWVKLGAAGAGAMLDAGANDLGGVLMDESITRAAGAAHGQQLTPVEMHKLIDKAGRRPRQRTTLYKDAPEERVEVARESFSQAQPVTPLMEPVAQVFT